MLSGSKYAKAIVASVIFGVGLLVQLTVIDSSTAAEITTAVSGVAAVFGVVAMTNAPG